MKRVLVVIMLCVTGCGRVTWRDYQGRQDWAIGSGFCSQTKDGLLIFEGLPGRPYEVLGIVEAEGPANAFTQPAHRKQMRQLIRDHDGNAMIIVGREVIRTGSSSSYSGTAYVHGNTAFDSGSGSSSDRFKYAMAVLAIRVAPGDTVEPKEGRDPVVWARSVLAGGTAVLGSETNR